MMTSSRRSPWQILLFSLAALALALALAGPAAARVNRSGPVTATSARADAVDRAARREAREHEREARAQERRAARAKQRAIRESERSSRRAGRSDASGEQGAPAAGSEEGASTPPLAETPSAAPRSCHLDLEASSQRIIAGESVTLQGQLTCPANVSAAGQQITVRERRALTGGPSLASLAAVATEADGSFKVTSPPLETNTIFQVTDGSRRARIAIKVAPQVTLAAPAVATQVSSTAGARSQTARRGRVTFTGTVNPAVPGALVALQLSYAAGAEDWHLVAFGRVAADGTYSVSHRFRTTGAVSVRTVVHVGKSNVPGISEPLTYEAVPSQVAQLTIQTSADPLPYGQSLTISGVAAGAANQQVTLLSRTAGGSFAPVESASTDASGNYTFTQAPLRDTYYRVSDAGTTSATVFEGVQMVLSTEGAPTALRTGETMTLAGTLTPAHEGQSVYLERRRDSGAGFQVLDIGSVTASSAYTLTYGFTHPGSDVMRIRVAGSGGVEGTASPLFTVTVTQ